MRSDQRASQSPHGRSERDVIFGDERLAGFGMLDLHDVSVEMEYDAVVGQIMSRNEEHSLEGLLHGGRVRQGPFRCDLHERRFAEFQRRCERGRRSGAVYGLLHQVRRPHDLVLIAGLALLDTGGEDLFGLEVRDRDAGAADLAPEHHRAMSHHTDEDPGWLRVIQVWISRRLALSRDGRAGQRKNERQKRYRGYGGKPLHLTFVPGSTSSRKVANPRTSLSPAASTMPCDSMPMSLAGFRLATMTIVLPISESGSYRLPIPATIWRCSVPSETWSFNSFSDFGTRSALKTF